MAASVQSGQQKGASASNETSTTVTKPTTAPSGDLIFICLGSDLNSNTITYDGSFTNDYSSEAYQSVATASIAHKTSGGSETDYTVTVGTTERQVWICFAVTGHNGLDGTPPASNSGSSGTASFPAITTSENNCLILRFCLTDQNATSTVPFGAMTGFTLIDEHFGTSAGGVGAWYKFLASAGTEAAGTATLNTSEQWWTATIAIKSAAASTKAPAVRPRVLRVWTINR